MFRLLKLATYALLGYALYEFFIGLTAPAQAQDRGVGTHNREPGEGGQGDESRHDGNVGKRITGQGRGRAVQTQDANGGAAPHVVGRGVVH